MSSRPRLISLDAFAKTVEDARVKTASGGLITLVCVLIVLLLIRNEYYDYTLLVVRPELAVNREVNKQLDITLDVLFPHVPCGVLTMDILDLTGDLHVDIFSLGFEVFRLTSNGEVKDDLPVLLGADRVDDVCRGLTEAEAQANAPCGLCYGALDQSANQHCCNTCEAVRMAYAVKQWGFYDGAEIAQCEQEGYVERMTLRIRDNEGCRIKGLAKINRILGNLHFAPGIALLRRGRHSHDLSLWGKYTDKFDMDHVVHHFSFGADPGHLALVEDLATSVHPLDGFVFSGGRKDHVALYYLLVVATRAEFMDRDPVETNQFSVITHDRPVVGGRDDDHQNTLHAQGGVPGVFFHFDILPMKIINREEFKKTWSGFVLGVVSSIAGVLTVGAVLDRSVWAAEQVLRGKKDL